MKPLFLFRELTVAACIWAVFNAGIPTLQASSRPRETNGLSEKIGQFLTMINVEIPLDTPIQLLRGDVTLDGQVELSMSELGQQVSGSNGGGHQRFGDDHGWASRLGQLYVRSTI